MTVIADFETANLHISLPEVGAEVYAQDPHTEVLCLVMLHPNGLPFVWRLGDPWENIPTPDHVEAHNAFFEQMIWKHILTAKHGIPEPAKWSCSMAKALFKGLPGGLDAAASAVGLGLTKDKEGRALTLSLSKPMTKKLWASRRPEGVLVKDWAAQYTEVPDRSPETIARVVDYCLQDCIVEQALSEKVGELSPYERRVYEFDNMVNHRGVRLDKEYIHQGMKVISAETDEMAEEFKRVTGGLEGGQIAKLRAWMAVQGIHGDSLDKEAVVKLLAGEVPDPVRRMLEIRQMLGSSSVTKLPRMVACAGRDGRSRGLLQYHGAGTGRWAGRLWQPQNLPARLGLKHTHEELFADIMRGDRYYLRFRYGDAVKAVASGVRYAIIPAEGQGLIWGDFSGIEARTVLAVAGAAGPVAQLAAGKDVYCDVAGLIYKRLITKADEIERTIGKNTVLGCGFQMGAATFMDRYAGKGQDLDFCQGVIDTYRQEWAPEVPKLWYGLEDAAVRAVMGKTRAEFKGIIYEYIEERGLSWLTCRLPDDQVMFYFDPTPCQGKFDKQAWSYKAWKDGQWKTMHAYGGLLTENAVQKLARGMMVEAMYKLEQVGFQVILTVHDEILCEYDLAQYPVRDDAWQLFRTIMSTPSPTAAGYGIPINVEGHVADRYRK